MLSREAIIEVLKTIEDPEILLDIWFLGLIYRIDIFEDVVEVDMTFTTPLCPAGPELIEQVRTKVAELQPGIEVKVKVVFDPPWQPNDEVRGLLGLE
jgi:metal-sulfur cluster biosynthetic enzyme